MKNAKDVVRLKTCGMVFGCSYYYANRIWNRMREFSSYERLFAWMVKDIYGMNDVHGEISMGKVSTQRHTCAKCFHFVWCVKSLIAYSIFLFISCVFAKHPMKTMMLLISKTMFLVFILCVLFFIIGSSSSYDFESSDAYGIRTRTKLSLMNWGGLFLLFAYIVLHQHQQETTQHDMTWLGLDFVDFDDKPNFG